MIGIVSKDYKYTARIYKQKAVHKQVEDDIKTMVYTMLGGDRKLRIEKKEDGFDIYPSCKNWEKKYCRCKNKKYMGYVEELGFMFYADSELGVYLEVLKGLLADQIIFPAVL